MKPFRGGEVAVGKRGGGGGGGGTGDEVILEEESESRIVKEKPLLKDLRYLLILPYMACHFGALITGIVYHPSWARVNGIDRENVR